MGALDDLLAAPTPGQSAPGLTTTDKPYQDATGKLHLGFGSIPVGNAPAPTSGPSPTPSGPSALDALLQSSTTKAPAAPIASSGAGSGFRGALQGLTFGTSDELEGLAAAAPEGVRSTIGQVPLLGGIVNAATGAVNLALHGDDAQSRYDKAVTDARAQLEADRSQHPILSTVGEIGGSLATIPATGFLNLFRGAGLGARIANSAIQGVAGGAAYGAGTAEGDLGKRAIGAAAGAGTGLAAGAALPILGAGVRVAGKAAGAPLASLTNPTGRAQRIIAEGLARDNVLPTDAANTLERARNAGIPMVVGDTGGAATRSRARMAASISQEGRQALEDVTDSRFQSQAERTVDFIKRLTPAGGNAVDIQEALKAAAAKANRPAYARAYADGASGVWTPTLEQLTASDAVQKAIQKAIKIGADDAAAHGFPAVKNPFQANRNGGLSLRTGPGGRQAVPNLQFWDYVKRALDNSIGTAKRAGASDDVRRLTGLKNQLTTELDAAVPTYKAARAGAAVFFGADDALEAGQKFVSSSLDNKLAKKALAKMSVPEQALFAEGFASELANQVSKSAYNRDVINSIFLNSPRAKERIDMALGNRAAGSLEAYLRLEGTMNRLRKALGGSMTARNLVEIGAVGTAGFFLGGGNPLDPKSWVTAALGAGLSRGRQKIAGAVDERVAREVAEMLASDDPQVLRNGINKIGSSSRLIDALRWAEAAIVRATGAESGESIARAQDQNQNQ